MDRPPSSKPQAQDAESHQSEPQARVDFHQPTTWYMMIFSCWVGLFGWLANFDAAFGGIVLVMPPYQKAFGHCSSSVGPDGSTTETCALTALQQSLIQLTVIFMSIGGGLTGIIGTYIGRRGTLQVASLFVAVGAGGMMGTAGSFVNYMVCKCIGGVGIGMIYAAAPTWGSESITPQKRGFLMSFYNVGLASGNVVAAAVCAGSSKISNDWAWRTPIFCQIPAALLLGLSSFLFHESPRWLLIEGKEEKARLSFSKFYQLDPYSLEIDHQVNIVLEYLELERALSHEASWRQLFQGVDMKRTHIAVLVLLGNALTGIQFVIPYTALFLSQIGLSNPYALNVAISSCVLAGTVPGPFLCEYTGRRFTLLSGYVVMGACMLIFAAASTGIGEASPTAHNVLVALLCIWAFTFGATSGPAVWVASPEMHSLRLRTIGQAYAVTIYEIFSFGAAFWTPYMLNKDCGDMGTNVGYSYFGITVVVVVLTYLFVPETGRLSLEQVDEYFTQGHAAWRTSLKENKRILADAGRTLRADKTIAD